VLKHGAFFEVDILMPPYIHVLKNRGFTGCGVKGKELDNGGKGFFSFFFRNPHLFGPFFFLREGERRAFFEDRNSAY